MRRVFLHAPPSGVRALSSRGQYNPIHIFDVSKPTNVAQNIGEFSQQITNPGPLRVMYTIDYLDWYHRAYQEKVKTLDQHAKRQEKYPYGSPSGTGTLQKIKQSATRRRGERIKAEEQSKIDELSVRQGMLDLFERQPQFPAIHIDRCSDYHIKELLKELFFDTTISPSFIWELAIMYNALLKERESAYPQEFSYIFKSVDNTTYAPDEEEATNSSKVPQSALDYFTHLVKKYNIENGVEAHIVLKCLDQPDADKLLFSNPPPRVVDGEPIPKRLAHYPPIEAMLLPENLNLARCLIFGEFNTMVSCDPFAKFPNAASHITRPTSDTFVQSRGAATSDLITSRREKYFARLTDAQLTTIKSRSQDISRLKSTGSSHDSNFRHELQRQSEEAPHAYQSDNVDYNPRSVHPEKRDEVSRKMLKSLRNYQRGRKLTTRLSIQTVDSCRRSRVTNNNVALAATRPTLSHFSALLLNDKHISFLVSTCESGLRKKLEEKVSLAARLLFKFSLEYHIPDNRHVNKKKLDIAFSLLDDMVEESLQNTSLTANVSKLGGYKRWSSRQIDESGYMSPARYDDYRRWMSATTRHKHVSSM